jgi:sugar (pentulose or hexulose) kinase
VKVFNGAHDQFCASIGSGAVKAGDMLISTGTTWVILSVAQKPLFTDTYIASCTHPVQGLYGNLVSLVGTGSSFEWVKNSLFSGEDFQQINQDCKKLRSPKKGLFYLPWPTGAFYPHWAPEARAGFVGMDLLTDKFDLAVAVMEAAAFNVKTAIEDFADNGCDTKSLRIMGGATKSDLWMGILRCVLDIPIQKMSVADTCAVGAASIALCASGCFTDFEQAAAALNKGEFVENAGYSTKYYQEKYLDYQKIIEQTIKFYKND